VQTGSYISQLADLAVLSHDDLCRQISGWYAPFAFFHPGLPRRSQVLFSLGFFTVFSLRSSDPFPSETPLSNSPCTKEILRTNDVKISPYAVPPRREVIFFSPRPAPTGPTCSALIPLFLSEERRFPGPFFLGEVLRSFFLCFPTRVQT